jgi:hypothetical protein
MKNKELTVRNIVKKFLKENGYHGLYFVDHCSCEIDDLMPGCEVVSECLAGYRLSCEKCLDYDDCEWDHQGKCIGRKQE